MNNKNAIVTGASRGIGKAIAICLASNGYNLYINCKQNKEALIKVKDEVMSYGVRCECHLGDMGDYSAAKTLVEDAISKYGHIDLLINNAGISHVGLLQDMSPIQWNNVVTTNLNSTFNLSNLVIPYMITNKCGKIINISSVWGLCGASCEVAYSASKGAINAFTKALGKELAPSNIQVNALACGAVDTEMNRCFSNEDLAALCEEIPAGRMAAPEEIANMVMSVINAPAYLNGEVIKIDGGWI